MVKDHTRKICSVSALAAVAANYRLAGRSIVLCHGCFEVVHPGHLRYLRFAREQGDVLVVSITSDDAIDKVDGTQPLVPQELRAENLASIELVDHVVVASSPTAEPVIRSLRPDIYVKGREYEHSCHPGFLAERAAVETLGGCVLFSSGEIVFSSTSLLDRIVENGEIDSKERLSYWLHRLGIDTRHLHDAISGFRGRRVMVVGDAIVDRYTFCDAHAVAGEAPVLSVRPIEEKQFIGGAAVIAGHLRSQGAKVHLITAMGDDAESEWLEAELQRQDIEVTPIRRHQDIPLKQRYVVDYQKVLKVDRVSSRPLDSSGERMVLHTLAEGRSSTDAVIFTDFGCGTVTLSLLAQAVPLLRTSVPVLAGDISGDRRSLLGYTGFDLLTPNERELRAVLGDFEQSLPSVADRLMRRLRLANLLVTMGARGSVLFRPREDDPEEWFTGRLRSEHIPSLVRHVVDPLGAGDACLAVATLVLAAGFSAPIAAYLGMAAAAAQTSRVGNPTLEPIDLMCAVESVPVCRSQLDRQVESTQSVPAM